MLPIILGILFLAGWAISAMLGTDFIETAALIGAVGLYSFFSDRLKNKLGDQGQFISSDAAVLILYAAVAFGAYLALKNSAAWYLVPTAKDGHPLILIAPLALVLASPIADVIMIVDAIIGASRALVAANRWFIAAMLAVPVSLLFPISAEGAVDPGAWLILSAFFWPVATVGLSLNMRFVWPGKWPPKQTYYDHSQRHGPSKGFTGGPQEESKSKASGDDHFEYDPGQFRDKTGGAARNKPADDPKDYGADKRHPDDQKLWNIVNDPSSTENERRTALNKIMAREGKRKSTPNRR